MTDDAEVLHDILAIRQLTTAEGNLKDAGRQLELVPGRRGEANALFRLADRVRAERMELLERCGLAS